MTPYLFFFFFNDTATTEIYTLSLHDALPISKFHPPPAHNIGASPMLAASTRGDCLRREHGRSEEHTSELQSRLHLVCRLLLEKKKKKTNKQLKKKITNNYTQTSAPTVYVISA